MDIMAEGTAADLTVEDHLCLWIGRAARAHVRLDFALRELFKALAYPSPARCLANSASTNRLVEDCRSMLKHAAVDETIIEVGFEVLNAAASANGERNRVVHDMWLQSASDQVESSTAIWSTFRVERGSMSSIGSEQSRDLQYVQLVYTNLCSADMRVSALNHALQESSPGLRGSFGDVTGIDWLRAMRQRLKFKSYEQFVSLDEAP